MQPILSYDKIGYANSSSMRTDKLNLDTLVVACRKGPGHIVAVIVSCC